jgi:hypothetical protein
MIKCVTLLIMSAHWYACIIALQTTLHTYAHETWLVKFGYCPEALEDHLLTVTHCTSEGTGVPVATWYLACYSWALLVITGAGVGGYPTPFSTAETIVVTCIQFMSAIMWALILASFCDLTTNANHAGLLFRQTIDDVSRASLRLLVWWLERALPLCLCKSSSLRTVV